ncbi:MAG: hypothetical protein MZU91_01915 [Desulfosudis oleivorans]|nr:hypothetical protein [Desulfosudis oleivorans]
MMDARPEILNHNVETVPRLFKTVQPQDNYEWAAATLSNAKKLDPEVLTKSGIMLGLGRDDGRGQSRDARPAQLGRGHPDHRSVSATEQEAHADARATTRWKNSPNCATSAGRSASSGWSRTRWCGRRITPRSRCAR